MSLKTTMDILLKLRSKNNRILLQFPSEKLIFHSSMGSRLVFCLIWPLIQRKRKTFPPGVKLPERGGWPISHLMSNLEKTKWSCPSTTSIFISTARGQIQILHFSIKNFKLLPLRFRYLSPQKCESTHGFTSAFSWLIYDNSCIFDVCWTVHHRDYWRIKIGTKCHLIFYWTSYRLNMFRALLCPSSGAHNCNVDYHIGRVVL